MSAPTLPSAEQYYEQIRLALNSFDDPAWLGEHSPLAAPYFLGAALPAGAAPSSPVQQGEELRRLLLRAADQLWGADLPQSREQLEDAVNEARRESGNKGDRYYFMLLELRYFRRFFRPTIFPRVDSEADIREYLGVGRGPFFNHIKLARQALGDLLLDLTRPALRPERPAPLRHQLIGREFLLEELDGRLAAGETIALTGPGGIGKSTLGSSLTQRWPSPAVFWYTLRPTLNDQIDSLFFALGFFCHQHGSSHLWRQLIADGGRIENPHLALGHLLADLEELPHRPLLCFDELDHLQVTPEQMSRSQQAFIELLTGLHTHVPLVLIGQQRVLPADHVLKLDGLDVNQTATLFQESPLHPRADELTRLQRYTDGNPRLLQLCFLLSEGESSLSTLIDSLPATPLLNVVFERLWQRLPAAEREMARCLAVFRSPAPEDGLTGEEGWPDGGAAVESLVRRRLALRDGQGGLALLPVYRDLIADDRQRLPVEEADRYHLLAAWLRSERAEYTAAASHLIAAGEPNLAVHLWFGEREREVRRGQGGSALQLFAGLSQRRLDEEAAEKLALLRAELYEISGSPQDGLTELEKGRWLVESPLHLEADMLRARFLNDLGRPDEAVGVYGRTLGRLTRLLNQEAWATFRLGLIRVQQRELHEAGRLALRARFQAEQLQGVVAGQQGRYEEAETAYRAALTTAAALQDEAAAAQIARELASIFARIGQLDQAEEMALEAITHCDQVGDRFGLEKVRNVLLAVYFNQGAFEKVVDVGLESLRFFQRARLPYWTSVTAATVAEAQYELGTLDAAEGTARLVLEQEEVQSLPYAMHTLGLIAHAQGNYAQARARLQAAQEVAARNEDVYLEAYIWRALGEAAAAAEDVPAAREAFQRALALFTELGISPEIDKTASRLAEFSED